MIFIQDLIAYTTKKKALTDYIMKLLLKKTQVEACYAINAGQGYGSSYGWSYGS